VENPEKEVIHLYALPTGDIIRFASRCECRSQQ
jgi:hypothetical protein